MSDDAVSSAKEPPGRPDAASYGRPEPADWRKYARFGLWVVIAVVALIFVFGNNEPTEVNFVLRTAKVPLYVALLISMILGILIGLGGVWLLGRRKAKKAKLAAKAQPKA
jgi:uncharacterized integral membrane protein